MCDRRPYWIYRTYDRTPLDRSSTTLIIFLVVNLARKCPPFEGRARGVHWLPVRQLRIGLEVGVSIIPISGDGGPNEKHKGFGKNEDHESQRTVVDELVLGWERTWNGQA